MAVKVVTQFLVWVGARVGRIPGRASASSGHRRLATGTVIALVVGTLTAGCGAGGNTSAPSRGESADGNREVEAFCGTVAEHKTRYETTMSGAETTNGLVNLLVGVSAVGDLQNMWADLAKTAPPDIATDAQRVNDAWQSQTEAAVSRDWAAAIATAMLANGSASRLNSYIAQNCGADLAPGGTGFEGLDAADVTATETLIEADLTDDDGYTFHIVMQSPSSSQADVDVANARPGEATVVYSATGQISITNTTPERNAPVPVALEVNALWAQDDALCEPLDSQDNADVDGYCGRAWTVVAPVSQLAPDETVSTTYGVGTIVPLVVPEDRADGIAEALRNVDDWALEIQETGRVSTWCASANGAC